MEAPPGFEPGMEVLQTSALPLGDGAGWNLCGKIRPRLRRGYNSERPPGGSCDGRSKACASFEVSAVLRGNQVLRIDQEIGVMQEGDLLEVFPIVSEGTQDRLAWAAHHAQPRDLEPTGTKWLLPMHYGATPVFACLKRSNHREN